MKIWRILTLTIVLVSVAVPLVAGLKAWLAPVVWAGALALIPPLAAAIVLVVYFEWRAKLRREILAANKRDDALANAA
jgi:hypothetical protein